MKQKITALLAAVFCVVTLLIPVSAGAETVDDRTSLLMALGIINGYDDGSLHLENNVSRAEFTKIAVAASSYRNSVAAGLSVSPFHDVPYSHWAAPYIRLAADNKLVTGYLDSTFRPDENVSYEEAVTMALRLLGYDSTDFGSAWPYGQVGLANNLKLTENINRSVGEAMTREDIVNLIYHLLFTDKKGAQDKYLSTFDCKLTENVTIVATSEEDASVGGGKVYTTAGTFKTAGSNFTNDFVGRSGDLIVQNTDDFLSFLPKEQTAEEYQVDTVIGADLILDGKAANLEDNLTVYYKSQKSTYQNIVSIANDGSRFVIYRDANGAIDYAFLFNNDVRDTGLEELEKYVVYSKLDDAVIAYKNGTMNDIPVDDSTVCYKDNQKSTYGSVKNSLAMGDLIYVKRETSGKISYISVEKGNVQGPVTVTSGSWYQTFGDISAMTVMRDGQKSSASALEPYDVAYLLKDMDMILAYSTKVTGIYTKAEPNKDLPESVTVSGTTYQIESVTAFDKLSSSGSFSYGDTVTLLLGKDGKIADVASPTEETGGAESGYLIEAGKKEFTRASGDTYTAYYATIVGTDGKQYEYETKQDYSTRINSVMRVTLSDGIASLSVESTPQDALGTVDADNSLIGTTNISKNIQIIDVGTTERNLQGSYTSVYLKRIDGVKLYHDDVLYYDKDTQGRITRLILNNVTGDAHTYGIVTSSQSSSSGMNTSGRYTVDIGGSTVSISGSKAYSVGAGQPVMLEYSGNEVESMEKLTAVSDTITSIDSASVKTKNKSTYLLSDEVKVYLKKSNSNYLILPLADVIGADDMDIQAYYDKSQAAGGRIRILVVTQK